MLHSSHEELCSQIQPSGARQAHASEVQRDVERSSHAALLQAFAQDEQGPAVNRDGLPEVYEGMAEPYFPSVDEAIDTNKEAHSLYGQPEWGGVLKPNELDSSVNS